MTSLLDVNLLLALAWAQHQHHDAAHNWFQRSHANGWATCLLTQSAFLRLSMNPHVVQVSLDCRTAHDLLTKLVAHPNHRFVPDNLALTDPTFDLLLARIHGHQQLTDATLLWLARTNGLKLVSFDRSLVALSPWPETVEVLSV